MFKIPIKVAKASISLVHQHVGLWNETPIQIGKLFGIGKVGYGGSFARYSFDSGLFEGFASFLEPNDYREYQLSKLSLLSFEWLLELLNATSISESEIEYALYSYHYSGISVPEWERESGQQNVQCCQRH